jgi:hypothetical protein
VTPEKMNSSHPWMLLAEKEKEKLGKRSNGHGFE